MAAQNICFYNKYGFCKYLEKCRKYHENEKCENQNCEIRECPLRHPKICKFYRDFGFCKFSEWCKFSHKINRDNSKQNDEIKHVEEKLQIVETELKRNSEKVAKLEAEIQDMHLKIREKDETVSKINKKFNFLKEKVTLLFDLEAKFDTLEKKVENILEASVQIKETSTDSKTQSIDKSENSSGNSAEIKCTLCEFVSKNKFGLKIHFHKKHSTAKFRCFTCDFTCENHSDLVDHNDKYYYSHRITLNKDYEKNILDEFQQLDEDGFLIHRLVKVVQFSFQCLSGNIP